MKNSPGTAVDSYPDGQAVNPWVTIAKPEREKLTEGPDRSKGDVIRFTEDGDGHLPDRWKFAQEPFCRDLGRVFNQDSSGGSTREGSGICPACRTRW